MEDFHKALKTGLGTEKLQLQTAARLFAAVALLSVVALVDLREKSRLEPDLPAETSGLTVIELRVLRHQRRRPLAMVRAVYLDLAALGAPGPQRGRSTRLVNPLARPPKPAPARRGREHGGATA